MWSRFFGDALFVLWILYGVGIGAIILAVGMFTGYILLPVPPKEKVVFLIEFSSVGLAALASALLMHIRYLLLPKR